METSKIQTLIAYQDRKKKNGVAYLLWFFLGWIGAHRIYIDNDSGWSYFQLCSLILGGFLFLVASEVTWLQAIGGILLISVLVSAFIDLFLIPSLVKKANLRIMKGLDINLDDDNIKISF